MFPINEIPRIEQSPEDYRLLKRVPWTNRSARFPFHPVEPVGDETSMVWLDVETTRAASGHAKPFLAVANAIRLGCNADI